MRRDFFKLSFYAFCLAAVLFDAGYLAFLGVQVTQIKAGAATLFAAFRPLSIASIAVNAALALYTLAYLIFRKR